MVFVCIMCRAINTGAFVISLIGVALMVLYVIALLVDMVFLFRSAQQYRFEVRIDSVIGLRDGMDHFFGEYKPDFMFPL